MKCILTPVSIILLFGFLISALAGSI